jgi:hypothetical protein
MSAADRSDIRVGLRSSHKFFKPTTIDARFVAQQDDVSSFGQSNSGVARPSNTEVDSGGDHPCLDGAGC